MPVPPNPDPALGRHVTYSGRVIDPAGTGAPVGLLVVLWGIPPGGDAEDATPLDVASTSVGGYLYGPWPDDELAGAFAVVAGEDPVEIVLEDKRLPARFAVVMDELPPAPKPKDEDCECEGPPRPRPDAARREQRGVRRRPQPLRRLHRAQPDARGSHLPSGRADHPARAARYPGAAAAADPGQGHRPARGARPQRGHRRSAAATSPSRSCAAPQSSRRSCNAPGPSGSARSWSPTSSATARSPTRRPRVPRRSSAGSTSSATCRRRRPRPTSWRRR